MWLRSLLPLIALAGCDRLFRIDEFKPGSTNPDGNGEVMGTTGPRVVFVSSTTSAGGALDGLAGADRMCQTRAADAQLPGAYRAWLSMPGVPVAARIPHTGGPFVLVDQTPIAMDWQALTTTNLLHAIDTTEGGAHLQGAGCDVWTNTTQAGLEQSPNTSDDCYDWTTVDHGGVAEMGSVVDVDARWTDHFLCNISCMDQARLYCFQQ